MGRRDTHAGMPAEQQPGAALAAGLAILCDARLPTLPFICSAAMLAGDSLAPAKGWLGGIRGLTEGTTPAGSASASGARLRQRVAAKHLVQQPGYSWLLPSGGGNFSREQAGQLVQGWPDEVPPEARSAAATSSHAQQADGGGAEAADYGEEGTQVGFTRKVACPTAELDVRFESSVGREASTTREPCAAPAASACRPGTLQTLPPPG